MSNVNEIQNNRLDALEDSNREILAALEGIRDKVNADVDGKYLNDTLVELDARLREIAAQQEAMREEIATVRAAPANPVEISTDGPTTASFPRGLAAYILESYFREDAARFAAELEAEKRAEKDAA